MRMAMNGLLPRLAILFATTCASLALGLSAAAPARAQDPNPPEEEQLKILTDPESVRKKIEKDKARPPIELFRTQLAPFDILPYAKAGHWVSVSPELRANYEDFIGTLDTNPIRLRGLPLEI